MAETSRVIGDRQYTGTVQFLGNVVLPANIITNAMLQAAAGLSASKLEHRFHEHDGQPNTAATDETRALYVARAAGTVLSFKAGSIAAATGDATVTVDLKKNGTTILSAPITLDNANTNRVAVAGTLIATPTYVAGDLLEVVIDGTIGTGTLPTGVFWQADLEEAPV